MGDPDLSLNEANFQKLRLLVHQHTGITIGETRKSMLLSRLRSRLRETQEPNFKAYIQRVSVDSDELQELINRVTTNKTFFYRTPRIWEHFGEVCVPDFVAKKSSLPMKVWSAAASSGEEAHTIGVLLEDVRKKEPRFDYSILGTDVSTRVLKIAEAGIYEAATAEHLQKERPDLFAAHVIPCPEHRIKVKPEIKSKISFKKHNLLKRLSGGGPFDVVFLRNVLIYFTPGDQEEIIRLVVEKMHPDGTLIIGESETLSRLDTGLEMVAPMVYRKSSSAREPEA